MTTNVTISTTYVHPGKKLRVRQVNPKDESQVYSEQNATQADVDEKGAAGENGVKSFSLPTTYVHDGAKLVVEEVE